MKHPIPAANTAKGSSRRSKPQRVDPLTGEIDVRAALNEPVHVKCDDGIKPMHAYEAMLHQRVRKALVNKCISSIEFLLDTAEKHKIIRPPPPTKTGGLFVVPKDLPEKMQRQIFDETGGPLTMREIVALLLTVISFERLKRSGESTFPPRASA